MLSHGDTPTCQNFVCLCQRAKTFCQTQIHGENIILMLRSKVKVINVHSCAKQSMTILKDKKAKSWTQSNVINPINLTLRIMNVLDTSSHGDRPICQFWYANVKANRSYRPYMETWQKPLNLTLRSKVNIESGSWMYATHCLMVKHPCAKYGKLMSIQK